MPELIATIIANQRDAEQRPHLSASSLVKHMRCPRQWQEHYLHGKRGGSSSSLIIGSAVHLALSRLLMGEDVGDFWNESIDDGPIDWQDPPDKAEQIAITHVYHYWETIGKYLAVERTETEYWIEVDGIPLPLLAYPDTETKERMIDVKTTRYFNRKQVRPNKEWKIAQAIYQLAVPKPSEIHVLTRSKDDPVVVPDSTGHALHFGLFDAEQTKHMVQQEWAKIEDNWNRYGLDEPWPGNSLHDWAGKYCNVERCCAL